MRSAVFLGLLLAVSPAARAADPPVIEVGKPFPILPLPLVGDPGTHRSLEDFRGRKLVLHLFASW